MTQSILQVLEDEVECFSSKRKGKNSIEFRYTSQEDTFGGMRDIMFIIDDYFAEEDLQVTMTLTDSKFSIKVVDLNL